MDGDEHFTFTPLPCHRYPHSGHTLPDLPPHGRLSSRQPQRGLDRALPPGPSPRVWHPVPVTLLERSPSRYARQLKWRARRRACARMIDLSWPPSRVSDRADGVGLPGVERWGDRLEPCACRFGSHWGASGGLAGRLGQAALGFGWQLPPARTAWDIDEGQARISER